MSDKSDKRLDRLFAEARAVAVHPSPREQGFEERLMIRLRERQATDAPWYTWAWRCSPVFAAVVVALILKTSADAFF